MSIGITLKIGAIWLMMFGIIGAITCPAVVLGIFLIFLGWSIVINIRYSGEWIGKDATNETKLAFLSYAEFFIFSAVPVFAPTKYPVV